MSMSFDAPATVASDERAGSLTRRMLSGAAAASLYAYRLDESITFLAHGMTPDGVLVVAGVPDGMLRVASPGFGIDVRMDLIKQSPDPAVSLVAASVHLLGQLSWATPSEVEAQIAGGALPELVEAMIEVPGARLGFVDIERALLHDMNGATVIAPEAISYAPPVIEDEFAAFDAIAAYSQARLKDLCWAVMVGAVPGQVVSKPPLPGICPHTADAVFCVDVDPSGVTVMFIGRAETLVVHACFDVPVTTQSQLPGRVAEMMHVAALENCA
ncbi:hypothetical protein [Tessaracoccus caeni]|uniref:hypothetical protein n=1 Tax=Tessaracoccus caeni TaxID=3031239 RepID=UPI0023DB9E28|nr:hypothetical protein [Tessaracoccus caeni]MDF1488319.1 hypothetical protein [Tessaracoccus caeni]